MSGPTAPEAKTCPTCGREYLPPLDAPADPDECPACAASWGSQKETP